MFNFLQTIVIKIRRRNATRRNSAESSCQVIIATIPVAYTLINISAIRKYNNHNLGVIRVSMSTFVIVIEKM